MNKDQKEQLDSELSFANMGKQVVNNEAYKQAIVIRKGQIFDIFCKTSKDQADIREEAWRTMKNMDALEQYFKTILETGKMAETMLKSIKD